MRSNQYFENDQDRDLTGKFGYLEEKQPDPTSLNDSDAEN